MKLLLRHAEFFQIKPKLLIYEDCYDILMCNHIPSIHLKMNFPQKYIKNAQKEILRHFLSLQIVKISNEREIVL